MSRLRRPFLSDRYIFVTVDLLKRRVKLREQDYECLAGSVARMRQKHGFLLTAWVFLPDHWHAIIYPPHPLTISRILKAGKVSSLTSINLRGGQRGELRQGRFFDRALRTVREYHETVEYIHLNPVRRGLVTRGVEVVELSRIWREDRGGAGATVRAAD
jgi:putative transposase